MPRGLVVGDVFNLTDRLYAVDPARTLAERELRIPNGFIEMSGKADVACHPSRCTDLRGLGGFDRRPWNQRRPSPMIETNAFVHVCIRLQCWRHRRARPMRAHFRGPLLRYK
jgi:hypothetical protein